MHIVSSVQIDPPDECCPKTATVTMLCGETVTTTADQGRRLKKGDLFKGLPAADGAEKCGVCWYLNDEN